ncbi:MAG TPA: hypothetical protein PK404_04785 [Fervidobacterium sp.]|nr:hypothetical protein [Fervidobacterium sp.]HOM74475.1 hypothetical protein [Fervidobacterium sp.]HPP18079.1 hypothetical protein [Fervidobacterium sp.]HPT54612.1 hypothetical protein [Fervidobacterium sp.]HQE49230.1 hypothetical protein [Fervidobacterium sp.]
MSTCFLLFATVIHKELLKMDRENMKAKCSCPLSGGQLAFGMV